MEVYMSASVLIYYLKLRIKVFVQTFVSLLGNVYSSLHILSKSD